MVGFDLLLSWLGGKNKKKVKHRGLKTKGHARYFRPRVTRLEDRLLMTVNFNVDSVGVFRPSSSSNVWYLDTNSSRSSDANTYG